MHLSHTVRPFVVAVAMTLSAANAFAQAAQKPFEPQVGQAGKDVVWVPTPQVLVEKMLDMAKVTPQDFVIDLGSGDGRTVITAAKRGARAMGIEYNPDMVELSQKNAKAAGVTDKATFVKADLFETDFSKANVVTMFLLPSINLKLRPKILDMKPGTRIVANSFNTTTRNQPSQTLSPRPSWPTRFMPSFQSPDPMSGSPCAPYFDACRIARTECSKRDADSADTRGRRYASDCPGSRGGASRNGTVSSSTAASPVADT